MKYPSPGLDFLITQQDRVLFTIFMCVTVKAQSTPDSIAAVIVAAFRAFRPCKRIPARRTMIYDITKRAHLRKSSGLPLVPAAFVAVSTHTLNAAAFTPVW